jgi:hypothetical protein
MTTHAGLLSATIILALVLILLRTFSKERHP